MKARSSFSSKTAALGALVLLSLPPALRADSLWQDGNSRSMAGDKRAAALGDILSIVIQETSTASKDNSTKTAKKTGVDVLPNQNLVIEGKRQTSFGGETQDIRLRGVVRPADITANNTVFSYNVAEATIRFSGKGTVSETQRKGWFTRVWEKVTPF